jgi:hypothetical protein
MTPMRALPLTVLLLAVAGAAAAQTCPAGTTRQTGGTPANPTAVGGNFTSFITGATICAARGSDRWQEFHASGGALIDFKRGAGHPVDPTRQVGTWTANDADSTVTHTYGPQSSFTWALCRVDGSNPVTYTMVMNSPTAVTITGVRVLAGQVPCP